MLNICEVNVYIVMMIVKIIVVDRYSRIGRLQELIGRKVHLDKSQIIRPRFEIEFIEY